MRAHWNEARGLIFHFKKTWKCDWSRSKWTAHLYKPYHNNEIYIYRWQWINYDLCWLPKITHWFIDFYEPIWIRKLNNGQWITATATNLDKDTLIDSLLCMIKFFFPAQQQIDVQHNSWSKLLGWMELRFRVHWFLSHGKSFQNRLYIITDNFLAHARNSYRIQSWEIVRCPINFSINMEFVTWRFDLSFVYLCCSNSKITTHL